MKPINLYELINAALEEDRTELTSKEKTILHKQPNNIVNFIQRILDEEIEKRTAEELEGRTSLGEKIPPQFNIAPAPHPSEFFLPSDHLTNAFRMFDECGDVQLKIHRTANIVSVTVNKLTPDMRLATDEDEMRAEAGITLSDAVQRPEAENIPLPPPGTEIILPPPPRGQTRPAPKGVESVPQKRQDPQPPHLPILEDTTTKQETDQATQLVQKTDGNLKIVKTGLPVFIGLPTQGHFHWTVNYSILGQLKKTLGSVKITSRIDIRQARNAIVASFLKSEAEWLYMQDADILAPFGNPGLFKEICKDRSLAFTPESTGMVAVETLIQSGKTLVGGVYATRDSSRRIVCNLGMNPIDEKERLKAVEIQRQGPKAGLVEVAWMGFGCVAIHRQVFTDITKRMPEIIKLAGPQPTDFFDWTSAAGEDATFCQRAIKAGHKPFLNTAVWCAHLGEHAYLP